MMKKNAATPAATVSVAAKKKPTKVRKNSFDPSTNPEDVVYLALAEQLHKIVSTKKDYKIPSTVDWTKWAKGIRDLAVLDGFDKEYLQTVMDWYAGHVNDEYMPQCFSGDSFRAKFEKLQAARCRSNSSGKSHTTTLRTRTTEIIDKDCGNGKSAPPQRPGQILRYEEEVFLRRKRTTSLEDVQEDKSDPLEDVKEEKPVLLEKVVAYVSASKDNPDADIIMAKQSDFIKSHYAIERLYRDISEHNAPLDDRHMWRWAVQICSREKLSKVAVECCEIISKDYGNLRELLRYAIKKDVIVYDCRRKFDITSLTSMSEENIQSIPDSEAPPPVKNDDVSEPNPPILLAFWRQRIREIIQAYKQQYGAYVDIADKLNKEGISTISGKKWNGPNVRYYILDGADRDFFSSAAEQKRRGVLRNTKARVPTGSCKATFKLVDNKNGKMTSFEVQGGLTVCKKETSLSTTTPNKPPSTILRSLKDRNPKAHKDIMEVVRAWVLSDTAYLQTWRGMADILNRAGYRTVTGGKWSMDGLRCYYRKYSEQYEKERR